MLLLVMGVGFEAAEHGAHMRRRGVDVGTETGA